MIWDEETGLIVRRENDGSLGYGDSAAESFRFFHLMFVRHKMGFSNEGHGHRSMEDLEKAFRSITSKDGFHLQRAPSEKLPPEWGDPVKDFPFDQTIPVVCALGAYGRHTDVLLLKRNLGFLYQNGQPILGDGYGCFKRALKEESNNFYDSFLWPTVLARCGKLPTWDVGLKRLQWGDPSDVEDDINLIHLFLQCETTSHTFQSQAAMNYYKKHRDVIGAVNKYYSDEPDKAQLYWPVLERVFR